LPLWKQFADYLADCQVGQSFTLATLKEEVEEDTPDLVLDWGRNDKTRDSLSSACSKCITAFSNQGLLICRSKKTFQVTEELIYLASAYDGLRRLRAVHGVLQHLQNRFKLQDTGKLGRVRRLVANWPLGAGFTSRQSKTF
jgi:hypothetical protein